MSFRQDRLPRVMIAGTGSGVGKTTITCGLLRALQRRGLALRSFKSGPDYLDPQFHEQVLGVPSRSLDLFLAGPDLVRRSLGEAAGGADLALLEGAMGYYDGIAQGTDASAFDLARATQTPAVLVVDGRGRSLSVAAEVAGFAGFRSPSQVAGVILNRVSAGYGPTLAALVQRETGLPVLGFVPNVAAAGLKSRHLGLVAAGEVADLVARVDAVADAVEQGVDLDALLALAKAAPDLRWQEESLPLACDARPCIAVARDAAFSFYYADTLELLERLGARLEFFSPLRDDALPKGSCGLYLGGGYPELHAKALSKNRPMLAAVRAAVEAGMPTIAECGGYLYLHRTLEDDRGQAWPLVGAVTADAYRGGRLSHFGYVTLTAKEDSLLARAGEELRAHEFHYWQSSLAGDAFCAQKPQSSRAWEGGVATPTLYAGFPHLYLAGAPNAAERFVRACAAYGARVTAGERRGVG